MGSVLHNLHQHTRNGNKLAECCRCDGSQFEAEMNALFSIVLINTHSGLIRIPACYFGDQNVNLSINVYPSPPPSPTSSKEKSVMKGYLSDKAGGVVSAAPHQDSHTN